MPKSKQKARKQVAALPVSYDGDGSLRVMLITSRQTKRPIIPKGWPMKGYKDHRAAAIEAKQEAGLLGHVHQKPVGSYSYWKRRADHFVYCRVKVFILEVTSQLINWREKGQRRGVWMLVRDAADLVDDPGLMTIIRDLPAKFHASRKARICSIKAYSDTPREDGAEDRGDGTGDRPDKAGSIAVLTCIC